MIAADTDVLIDSLAGHEPTAARVARELERESLSTTAITPFELLCGARHARQEDTIRQLLAVLPTLPLHQDAADQAARGNRLKAKGLGTTEAVAGSVGSRTIAELIRHAPYARIYLDCATKPQVR